MGNRLVRFLTFALQVSLFIIIGAVDLYGIVVLDNVRDSYLYIASVVRSVTIFLIAAAYYKTSITKTNPGNFFIRAFLIFAAISELRILTVFTELTGWSFIPPRIMVRIEITAQLSMMILLIFYAILYSDTEHGKNFRYLFSGIAAMIFLGTILPAPQGISQTWNLSAPLFLLLALGFVGIVSNIIIAFTEPSVSGKVRQASIITFTIGNFIALLSGSITMEIIGTAFLLLGGMFGMVIALRNSVIL